MKRKDYKKPAMQVVKLHQQGMLMQSGVESTRNNYGEANEQEWP